MFSFLQMIPKQLFLLFQASKHHHSQLKLCCWSSHVCSAQRKENFFLFFGAAPGSNNFKVWLNEARRQCVLIVSFFFPSKKNNFCCFSFLGNFYEKKQKVSALSALVWISECFEIKKKRSNSLLFLLRSCRQIFFFAPASTLQEECSTHLPILFAFFLKNKRTRILGWERLWKSDKRHTFNNDHNLEFLEILNNNFLLEFLWTFLSKILLLKKNKVQRTAFTANIWKTLV